MNIIHRSAATALVAGVASMGLATQVAPAMAATHTTTHAAHHVVAKKTVAKKTVAKKAVAKKAVAKKTTTKKNVAKKPVTKKPVTKKPVPKKPVTKKPVPKKPAPAPVKLTEIQAEALATQILTDRLDKTAVVTTTTPSTHGVTMQTTNADASQSANVTVHWTTQGAADDSTPYDTCDTVPEIGCGHQAFGTGTVYELSNAYGHELDYVRADKTVIRFSEYNQEEMADFLPVPYDTANTLLTDTRWDQVVTSLATTTTKG